MKGLKKIGISIVLVLTMMMQLGTVYGATGDTTGVELSFIEQNTDTLHIFYDEDLGKKDANGNAYNTIVSKYVQAQNGDKKVAGWATVYMRAIAQREANAIIAICTFIYDKQDGTTPVTQVFRKEITQIGGAGYTEDNWREKIKESKMEVSIGNFYLTGDIAAGQNIFEAGVKGHSLIQARNIKLDASYPKLDPQLTLTAEVKKNYVALDWSKKQDIPTSAVYKISRKNEDNNSYKVVKEDITITNAQDFEGIDKTGPTQPKFLKVNLNSSLGSGEIELSPSSDKGTAYTYKVEALKLPNKELVCTSNEAVATVTAGLEGYIIRLSNHSSLKLEAERDSKGNIIVCDQTVGSNSIAIDWNECLGVSTVDFNEPVYIYMAAVDKGGNLSKVSQTTLFSLKGKEVKEDKENGNIGVELNWTKPDYLRDFTLIKTSKEINKETNQETIKEEKIEGQSGQYVDKLTKEKPNTPAQVESNYGEGDKAIIQLTPAEVIKKKFEYVVKAKDSQGSFYTTNSVEFTLQAGIKGYRMSIDNDPKGSPKELKTPVKKESKWTFEEALPTDLDRTKQIYIHIQTVDNYGNLSEVITVPFNVSYAQVKLSAVEKATDGKINPLESFEVGTSGPNLKEKILDKAYPLIADSDGFKVEVITSKQLEPMKYRFIESDTKPSFPTSDLGWEEIKEFNYTYKDATDKETPGFTTTGTLVTTEYKELKVEAALKLPDIPEDKPFYLAVEVQEEGYPAREVLYGPFAISDIKPDVIVSDSITTSTNYVAPEGYSCIEIDIEFPEGAKERKLTLDLSSIIDLQNSEPAPLLNYDLGGAIFMIKDKVGEEGKKIDVGTLSTTEKGFVIEINEGVSNNYFDVTIFVPTRLEPTTNYSKNEIEGTCLYILKEAQGDGKMIIPAKAEAKIVVKEASEKDGKFEQEEYRDVLNIENRDMKYVPIPTIN